MHQDPAVVAEDGARVGGPRSSATLASVSASSMVGASAVAVIRPVHTGSPVLGSSR